MRRKWPLRDFVPMAKHRPATMDRQAATACGG
jgi:hypothetical protein